MKGADSVPAKIAQKRRRRERQIKRRRTNGKLKRGVEREVNLKSMERQQEQPLADESKKILLHPNGGGVHHVSARGELRRARLSKEDGIKRARYYYLNLATAFKEEVEEFAKKYGILLPIELDVGFYMRKLDNPDEMKNDMYVSKMIEKFSSSGRYIKGQLSREQIFSIVEILCKSYRDSSSISRLNILGATQSGKSGTVIGCFFLESIVASLLDDKVYRPVLSLVNERRTEKQITNEFLSFGIIHNYLVIRNTETGDTYGLCEYFKDVLRQVADEARATFDWGNCVLRNKVQNVEKYQKIFEECMVRGHVPIVYIDECHFGSGVEGLMAQWARQLIHTDFNVFFRFVSATPFEHLGAELESWLSDEDKRKLENIKIPKVLLPLGPGYVGFSWFMGYSFPRRPGYKEQLPQFYSYQDFFECANLCWNSFKSPSHFLRKQWNVKNRIKRTIMVVEPRVQRAWREYRKKYILTLEKMIRTLLFSERLPLYYMDGQERKRSSIICIRVANENEDADKIYDKLTDLLPDDLVIMREYTPHTNRQERSMEEAIQEDVFAGGREKAVILVTGGARMSVHFPPSVGYFIDLTNEASYTSSFLQGLIGRAQGYRKNTVVFLSTMQEGDIREYISNKGKITKKPHARARYTTLLRGAPQYNVDIRYDEIECLARKHNCQLVLDMFNDINYLLAEEVARRGKIYHKGSEGNRQGYFCEASPEWIWDSIMKAREIIGGKPFLVSSPEGTKFEHLDLLEFEPDVKKRARAIAAAAKGTGSAIVSNHEEKDRRWAYDGMIGRLHLKPHEDLNRKLEKSKTTRRTSRADKKTFQPQLIIDDKTTKCLAVTLALRTKAKPVADSVEPTEKSIMFA